MVSIGHAIYDEAPNRSEVPVQAEVRSRDHLGKT